MPSQCKKLSHSRSTDQIFGFLIILFPFLNQARAQYTNNAIYGSNGVYGHGGHHVKSNLSQASEYSGGGGHYGQGGYLMGYERQGGGGGQASRLAREIETMSASSGSVNARRRTNRGTLEQVNILGVIS